MDTLSSLAGLLLVLAVVYAAHAAWLSLWHARRARQLGCQPAFVRPYRWPFALDILKRIMVQTEDQNVQNDDVKLYEEMGCRPTWYQNILGDWHHLTSDPKNIQAILATQFKDFQLGPLRRGALGPLLGHGIFTNDGVDWERSRAMLRPQFARGQVADLMLEEVHVQHLFNRLVDGENSWTTEVDLVPLFFNLTLDSATEFLFGKSVLSQNNPTGTSPGSVTTEKETRDPTTESSWLAWSSFGHHFDSANVTTNYRSRLMGLYWLYNPRRFQDDCREVHKCIDYFVQLALTRQKKGQVDDESEDHQGYIFLHELVKTTQDPVELRSQLLNILLAGRDTTAGLLGWTFYLLARHPATYQALRTAVLDTFGTGKESITFEALKSCSYLQHTMSEVLRLEPVVPENSRCAVRNTTLPNGGGPDGRSPIYIRAGQEVAYNVHIMHRRQDIWGEDANEFRPERWQGRKTGWEFLPFNGGPRICLGQQFALTEAGYVIVRILQRYDRVDNLGDEIITKRKYTSTTSPTKVLVRLHEALPGKK